jgi:hypothetical protein
VRLGRKKIDAGSGPTQCSTCLHWQRRGGAVFAARQACSVIEDLTLPAPAVAVLLTMARELALAGRCPNAAPFTNEPGSYITQELPL